MTTYTASEMAASLYLPPRPKQYIVNYFGWSVNSLDITYVYALTIFVKLLNLVTRIIITSDEMNYTFNIKKFRCIYELTL